MTTLAIEIIIILLLLVANGVFAMTEIAVVSARKARLRRLAAAGDLRAKAALELAESPNRFLATVQVGITLVGVLAGAFGGATIAEEIAAALQWFPMFAAYGEAIGIGVVVLGITFCSLILGELVPKRIGLNNPERIARLMAGPMNRLARLASPLVRLLSASTELVLHVIRRKKPQDPPVTEEEVKVMIQEGVQAGVFGRHEPEMVEGVLALDRLPVHNIMTPPAKIIWINHADPHEAGCIIELVTLIDVMEVIAGEFPSPAERLKPEARKRADGTWLVDGSIPLENLVPMLPALHLLHAEKRDYATLGECVATRLAQTPKGGETFDEQGFRFEALDMDGARVDKVLIMPLDSGSPLLKPVARAAQGDVII